MKTTTGIRRVALGSILVGAALLGPLPLETGYAHTTTCRTDPIVRLSNGDTVDLTNTVDDAVGDVSGLSYTLTIPPRVSVTSITYTGGWAAGKESVIVRTGTIAGYSETTTTYTGAQNVTVTAQISLMSPADRGQGWTSATGHSNNAINLQVSA